MLTRSSARKNNLNKNKIKEEILENFQEKINNNNQLNNNEEENDLENIPQIITRNFIWEGKRCSACYNFLKIVKDVDELNILRNERHCSDENIKRWPNFAKATLHCYKRFRYNKCPYSLFSIRKSFGIYVYEHGEHNHVLEEQLRKSSILTEIELSKELLPQQNEQKDYNDFEEEIPQIITREFTRGSNYFKLDYTFLKTVKDDEELKILRFEKNCKIENIRRYPNFRSITLNCFYRFNKNINCPYGLFAIRKSFGINIYEHGEHNHEFKVKRSSLNELKISEINCPESSADNWRFLCSINGIIELNKIRIENKCQPFKEYHLDSNSKSILLNCSLFNYKSIRCPFQLIAKRINNDGEYFNVYLRGEHNCNKVHSIDKVQKRLERALKFGQYNRVHKWMKRTGSKRINLIINSLESSLIRQMIILANKEMRTGNKDKKNN